MTQLIRGLYNVTTAHQGGVLTIGNFDGVHLGHQALLQEVVHTAKVFSAPAIAVTFEPHPFEFFSQQAVVIPRLTRLREKFCALAATGVQAVVVLPFNQSLASLNAQDFVKQLYQTLRPSHIIIGDDFRYGFKRQGDFALLQQLGKQWGFSVATLPTFKVLGERVSSTRVRQALAAGNHLLVELLLGRPYSMMGRVRGGDRLGRQLGFPTANIYLHRKLSPVFGVYVVMMTGVTDQPWPGVANVGTRPAVGGTHTLLEVHLLDFNQDIYRRYVRVDFLKKLRAETHFDNLNLLRAQIAQDVEAAKAYFRQESVR